MKTYVRITILIVATFVLLAGAFAFFIHEIAGPPFGEETKAKNALKRSINAIASGNEVNDLIIRTDRWNKLSEFSEDFISDYNITGSDYTFGDWEFGVKFPKIEKEYYFDLVYHPNTSKWKVFVKPVGKCLKPRFQIRCLLPEYKQVKMNNIDNMNGSQFTFWYEADPNIVINKDDVRSRIMNALSEDGWQPIPLPGDSNSLSNTKDLGPDDLYYSLQALPDDHTDAYIHRIHISEDAKRITICFSSKFIE
jgi:hypothetical protein